jgi:Asp-tRNA(Asn)/Glu-tRNA(Gln) amidotransferase A subunit family amidase
VNDSSGHPLAILVVDLDGEEVDDERGGLTAPINLSGLPALALPLTVRDNLPASLQLVGPQGGEELLIAIGRIVEAALLAG